MKLAVLGAGEWGQALTWLYQNNFEKISVWSRNPAKNSKNLKYKTTTLFTTDLALTIEGADIILLVVSTSGIREVLQKLKSSGIKKNQIIVNTSKGLELGTFKRMSEIIQEELPDNPFAILSGPTLSAEVIEGKPTAACIASYDAALVQILQEKLSVSNRFRLYTNTDVIGVELGGSLKNIIAIAAGFVDAQKLGSNAKGAILTRGLAEIVRISVALKANPATLYGLAGVGDLIATCSSPLSRNYKVGYLLGQNKKINQILNELGSVAEGVKTTKAVCDLAKKMNIDIPLSSAVYEALYTEITPEHLLEKIMTRKLKQE